LRRWDNFLAWLYSITSNLCKMHIRSQSRRPDREFVEDQNSEALEEPSIDPRRQNPLLDMLDDALDSLPETYHKVLTLYYLGGMNSREIARFLGTSPTAIRHRLTRARSQLKEGMVAMMSENFEPQRLQASFTFRMVEAIKHIKIKPMPRATGLPWGLSLAAGIILTVMSFGAHLSIINPASVPTGAPLPVEARVLKAGEIPVDIMKVSEISFIANKQGDGDGGELNPQNAALIAAPGAADTWAAGADMPTTRYGHSASVVNGKIYVIGGSNTPDAAISLAAVEEYNPATDTWTTKANMPAGRCFHSASVVNGKIYTIGGSTRGQTDSAIVEAYDPAADTWATKANMPTERCFHCASVVDGKIYVFAGEMWPEQSKVLSVEMYDPATDTWTTRTDIPTPRAWPSASVVDGKIYVIGGVKGPASGSGASTVEMYNPVTDAWSTKADMPTGRKCPSTSVVDGKVYVIGGATGINALFSTVEVYDPATDTWTTRTDMPTSRCLLSSVAVDGKIYAIGGDVAGWPWGSTPIVEVYETGFVPPEESSSVEPKGKLFTAWGDIKFD